MATESWATRIRHDSNETYQEWRDELITKLGSFVTAGVLAADETNITPGAGARPGTNTEQGYAVYHLDDSLHATAPVYIRFGFGTAGVANAPRIQVTLGTATDGSGGLSGTGGSIASIHGSAAQATDTTRQSYMSCVPGFFGLSWKVGSGVTEAGFWVARTVDSAGAPTALGSLSHWGAGQVNGITKRNASRYAAPTSTIATQSGLVPSQITVNPLGQDSSVVDGDNQAMLCYTLTPRIQPLVHVCGVLSSELSVGTTFNTTLVGTTQRTYIVIGQISSGPINGIIPTSGGGLTTAMIWE